MITSQHGVLTMVLIIAACNGRENVQHEDGSAINNVQPRTFVEVQLDSVSRRCFPDSSLLLPKDIRVSSSGIWVSDIGGNRILLYDSALNRQWSFGRTGAAPGEFRSPRDIQLVDSATLAVLDPGNGRITEVSANGKLQKVLNVSAVGGHSEGFVPLSAGRYLLVTMRADSPLAYVDTSGRVVRRAGFEWTRFSQLLPLASQSQTISSPDHRAAVSLTFGEVFFAFDDGEPRFANASYVEIVKAPDLRPQVANGDTVISMPLVPLSSRYQALDGDTLYSLFDGRTAERGRIVDMYSISSGKYISSWLLPRPVAAFAVFRGRLYTLNTNPVPCIAVSRIVVASGK